MLTALALNVLTSSWLTVPVTREPTDGLAVRYREARCLDCAATVEAPRLLVDPCTSALFGARLQFICKSVFQQSDKNV